MPDDRHIELHALLEGLPEPAMVLDRRLVITMANRALAARLDRPVDSIVGLRLGDLMTPEDAERRERAVTRVFASGEPITFEDRRADRHFASTIVPIRGPSGEVTAAAALAIDITLGKLADERLRRIVATSLEGIWEIDAESRTTFVNDQMARMLGYTPDDMVGRSLYDFMDDEARATAVRNVARRQRGIAERHEFRLQRRDGSPLWVIMAASPLTDEHDAYAGAVAMVTDVTEIRALENKIQNAQKLESLGLLAGGVAHDFNNLLVGILGNASLAAQSLPEGAEARAYLDEIVTAGERAAELIRQLLTYAGRSRLAAEPLDLRALVAETSQLARSALPKGAWVEVSPAGEPIVIAGDGTQLRQVVMNLIINAGEAMSAAPRAVTISTAVDNLDAERLARLRAVDAVPGRFARLEVKDTGCGMDAQTQERIFDPFFTTKDTGRGLGLAAVLGILRAHRGAVEVESQPERGTTIRLFLPVAEGAPAKPPSDDASEPYRTQGLALVVDDQPEVRAVLVRLAEHLGMTTIACDGGQEALRTLGEGGHAIRLAIIDVTMPDLNGTELLTRIRDGGHDFPVLLVSGRQRPPIDEARAGRHAFLAKPFDLADLRRAVRRLLTA